MSQHDLTGNEDRKHEQLMHVTLSQPRCLEWRAFFLYDGHIAKINKVLIWVGATFIAGSAACIKLQHLFAGRDDEDSAKMAVTPRLKTETLQSGHFVYYELVTDGVSLDTHFSMGGHPYELPKSIQIQHKPIIDATEHSIHIEIDGAKSSLKLNGGYIRYLWLPSQKALFVDRHRDDGRSQIWRWDRIAGFRPISKFHKDLQLQSISLDGSSVLASVSGSDVSKLGESNDILICSTTGNSERIVVLPGNSWPYPVMLNLNEFLIQFLVFNDGEYIKKWVVNKKRAELLPMKGRLSSVVVYNGALWGHRHQGGPDGFYPFGAPSELVRLNPDLKTIEQTVPLPKGLEHVAPFGGTSTPDTNGPATSKS